MSSHTPLDKALIAYFTAVEAFLKDSKDRPDQNGEEDLSYYEDDPNHPLRLLLALRSELHDALKPVDGDNPHVQHTKMALYNILFSPDKSGFAHYMYILEAFDPFSHKLVSEHKARAATYVN